MRKFWLHIIQREKSQNIQISEFIQFLHVRHNFQISRGVPSMSSILVLSIASVPPVSSVQDTGYFFSIASIVSPSIQYYCSVPSALSPHHMLQISLFPKKKKKTARVNRLRTCDKKIDRGDGDDGIYSGKIFQPCFQVTSKYKFSWTWCLLVNVSSRYVWVMDFA